MKNIKKLVKTLAVSTIGLGIVTVSISEAQAVSLVPQREGEIKTNLGCLDPANCIDTESELGYKVTSFGFEDFDPSRLFSDDRGTTNNYAMGIEFILDEEGTRPDADQFYLRPVAFKNGQAVEDGRLEVGLFEFDFGRNISEIKLDFFDVEYANSTKIFVDGQIVKTVASGANSNIQSVVLKDLSKFTVQLGEPGGKFGTGDGVALQVSVPESENFIGLSALAVAGVLTLKRRKTASQKA
ncbi:LEVG family PEP-CTERM protein [Calothrix sp. CCY 0018]|uniref:LEVG family PEP-CTERM protein n=1 Tax=Calothrix sp. CCY 0018 TaxID=3103864 RepID=UPI0039C6259F